MTEIVRVKLYNGILRLDPRLYISDRVTVEVDTKNKLVFLERASEKIVSSYKLWFSNSGAKSPMLRIRSVLKALAVSNHIGREFAATLNRDGSRVTIDLSKPL
jgi:hypothetical protein